MQIVPNRVVTLTYALHNSKGELIDQADSSHPFSFIHGIGMTIPGFDKGLFQLKAGDAFDFSVSPEEGYGEYYEDNIVELDIEVFVGAPDDVMQIGNYIPMQDQEGNRLQGKILEIRPDVVVMDFNHPLAGETLRFTGNILHVREATREELATGQVRSSGLAY
ncbi:MAG: peptidylprolyl isomerase [Cytophagales bacterium]|nr:peptidylprolyl isomerase [Cytophagales bacterium]MDW8384036.1 peptidylprolyl isomerase [Flammeovirgaceae bacterium]